MQSNAGKKAIIIGGGIGGVTAAIALQQAGFDVTIFEQAEELREVGSGLPLWTNALRALYKLGLTDIVETIGESVTGGSISTWQGDILAELRAEDLLKKLGVINIVVHRAELLAMLLKALGEDKVQLGARCVGFTQDAALVTARFADGREAAGDLLIGADGLHSVMRSQLFGATKPRYAGYTCWCGHSHIKGTGLGTWAWGKGYQFGIAPMNHGRAYWFAQKYAPEGEHDKAVGRKHEVLELFHDWHDPIPAVIEATEEADILRNDIYESEPLRHWSHGRVTLLGDAAHTMTPNLGMGACQAIEDAAVLGACLKAEEDIAAALKVYEKRRVRHANAIAFLARLVGQIVQLENPGISNTRNVIMKRTPMSTILKRLMLWMVDYEV
jgi:2-polyprenyl-6-methoxyphenol hydroxylase-like FAD-dependent oxidoreductase